MSGVQKNKSYSASKRVQSRINGLLKNT